MRVAAVWRLSWNTNPLSPAFARARRNSTSRDSLSTPKMRSRSNPRIDSTVRRAAGVRGTIRAPVFPSLILMLWGCRSDQSRAQISPALMPVCRAKTKARPIACEMVAGAPVERHLRARSIALISVCVRVFSLCLGWAGRRTSRMGFVSSHRHSRLAASKTVANAVISRRTEPGLTFANRESRQAPKSSGVIESILRVIGSVA